MDVNHLQIAYQSEPGHEANGNEDRPALRSITKAFCHHLPNERGVSAWGDHLCVCACTHSGWRELLFSGALLNFLSVGVEGRVAHREIECIRTEQGR